MSRDERKRCYDNASEAVLYRLSGILTTTNPFVMQTAAPSCPSRMMDGVSAVLKTNGSSA